tara:strand:- start:2373 stop:2615 length:243 start_codon:yes stop_codon:yes gene_type:complete
MIIPKSNKTCDIKNSRNKSHLGIPGRLCMTNYVQHDKIIDVNPSTTMIGNSIWPYVIFGAVIFHLIAGFAWTLYRINKKK